MGVASSATPGQPAERDTATKTNIGASIAMWEELPSTLLLGRKEQVAEQESSNILKLPQRHLPVSVFSPGNTQVLQYHWGTPPNPVLTVEGKPLREGGGNENGEWVKADFILPKIFFIISKEKVFKLGNTF